MNRAASFRNFDATSGESSKPGILMEWSLREWLTFLNVNRV